MKVSNVGGSAPTGGARRADKTAGKGQSDFKQVLAGAIDAPDEPAFLDAPSGVGMVDSLLAIQSVGDATDREGRRRLVRRGEEMLDRLEDLRRDLLLGSVPTDKLVALAQMVRMQRGNCADPQLGALLDEIELRAEVELAKLSRGL